MNFLDYQIVRTEDKKDERRTWFELPEGITTEFKHIKVSIYYSLGGMNYFSGNANPRGYYVSITPVTLNETPWGYSEQSVLLGKHSGGKILLQEATRFNAKTFAQMDTLAQEQVNKYAEQFVASLKVAA